MKIKAFVVDKNQFCAIIISVFVAVICLSSPAQAVLEGYYCDLFIDGGVSISNRDHLAAANYLGLSQEFIATGDRWDQNSIMIQMDDGDWQDDNGVLLYPDGEPRFHCMYVGGGQSVDHGISLGEEGRQRVRDYYHNGGCYTGSCAGAAMPFWSMVSGSNRHDVYFWIFPVRGDFTGISNSFTDFEIPDGATAYRGIVLPRSPLLDYFDFGGDYYIESVRQNGGNWARFDGDIPMWWLPQAEVLATYVAEGHSCDEGASCWAYKEDANSGRLCPCGGHPENITSGEQRDLQAALLQYAMAGNGSPTVKAALENGVTRQMNDNSTSGHEKLGDLQYHHFAVDLPAGMAWLRITLDGDAYDLNLFARKDDFAFKGELGVINANNGSGADETLTMNNPEGGVWYIGIKCATTVTKTKEANYYRYTGNLGVLNGVAYSITAEWNGPNGDLTYDGKVDYNDVKMLSLHWLEDNRHYQEDGDLIGWWEFDDGDGNTAADSSGYDNTGTLYDRDANVIEDPNWQNGALVFDGNTYVQTADDANKLQLTGSYTLSVWLKVDAVQSDWAGILAKCAAGSGKTPNHWSLLFGGPGVPDTTGKLVVWNGFYPILWDTGIELSDISGLWYHIAIVRSSTTMASYLDGKMVTYGIFEVDPNGGYGHLNIGAERTTQSCYKGLIGDVSIYDYQLSSDEVKELSLEHPVGQLVGWWNFDDADANDNSGNEHHGTIMGSVTIVADANIIGGGNKVAKFPGDASSFIDCGGGGGDSTWADFAGDTMTIAAWFKTDGVFYTSYQYVCAKEDMWRVSRYSSSENIRFFNTGLAGGSTGDLIGTKKADDGQWHHVVGVYDGANRYLYFDGELDVFDSRTGNLAETTWDVYIGGNGSSPGRTWRGWIDDVRLYDYALSKNAVELLYGGSQSSEPVDYLCFERPIGDLNGDCKVDWRDFETLASNWLESNL